MSELTAIAGPHGASAAHRKPASRYGGTILFGWVVVLVTFGCFGAWAAMAPLDSAAIAQGTVVVDSHRKSVQHLEGGIVKRLLVRNGDHVEAGQVLVELEAAQARASRDLLRGRSDADRAYVARLIAERDWLPVIRFPADLTARAADEPALAEILSGQRNLFEARRQSFAGQIVILDNRIAQSRQQIAGLETQSASKDRQIALLGQELDGLRELMDKGYVPKNKVLDKERQLAQVEGERGQIAASIAGVRQAIEEAALQAAQLRKSFRESVETELRQVQAQVADLEQQLDAATDQLSRLQIVAPVSGTVVDMTAHTPGGVVAPGSRILDIVPEDDPLVVEAQVSPADIDGVVVGLPAQIRFSAFDQNRLPALDGTVTLVSADRLIEPRTQAPYFAVRVRVADGAEAALGGLELVPGMPAEVIIGKGEGTLLDALVAPIKDVLLTALRE